MKKKLIKKIVLTIIVVAIIIINKQINIHRSNIALEKITTIPESYQILYNSERNYRQDYNGCGPFSVAATMRALGADEVDSIKVGQEMFFRVPKKKITLPRGLEIYLKNQGYNIATPELHHLSKQEKIIYLQHNIAQNHPIILLGDLDGYQHYLTILGYNNEAEERYIYDSIQKKDKNNQTIDENGNKSGNTTRSTEKLFTFRNGGGVLGAYKNYALIVSNSNFKE